MVNPPYRGCVKKGFLKISSKIPHITPHHTTSHINNGYTIAININSVDIERKIKIGKNDLYACHTEASEPKP
jgi:hypothetical protein